MRLESSSYLLKQKSFMTDLNVLCTSVGNYGFPSVLSSLRQRQNVRIIGVDANHGAVGLRLADVGVVVPPRAEPDALIDALRGVIEHYNVHVILPLSTEDQPFFAKHFDRFGKVPIAVSPLYAVQKANDKHALYIHAQSIGIPIPDFRIVDDNLDLEKMLIEYQKRSERCVLKRPHGTGAQGVKVVNPHITFKDRFWQRDNVEISCAEAINWARKNYFTEPILISDYLPGEHLSVDSFRSLNGEFQAVVRTETSHLFGTGVAGITISDPSLIKITKKLAESLGLLYGFNVEYKRDLIGEPRLLEINPRFGASIGHSVAAGLNLPLMVVDAALTHSSPTIQSSVGLEFRRYWDFITW
jgi:carbamoyl-phosphate synthase large subunit